MNLERAVDRKFLGFRSILGYLHWAKTLISIFKNRQASIGDKFWCIRHGFSIGEYNCFGHDNLKKNYMDYLSTKQYMKLHPINGMFSLWIDDKLTMKHVLGKFGDHTPLYYFDIEDGKALRLSDCPDSIKEKGYEGIIALLEQEKKLAMKKLIGAYGLGFYRLEFADGKYAITGKEATKEEVIALLKSLNHYLVTEYVENHETLKKIWPDATNTLRILIANPDGEPILLRSFFRFGNANSNGVDNAHSGGLEVIVDEEKGKTLFAVSFDAQNYTKVITQHPDSGVSFTFDIPRWDEIIAFCMDVCRSYPELKYVGFDIVITQDSFKVLEINSLSGLQAAQLKEPFMKDLKTKEVFQSFAAKVE